MSLRETRFKPRRAAQLQNRRIHFAGKQQNVAERVVRFRALRNQSRRLLEFFSRSRKILPLQRGDSRFVALGRFCVSGALILLRKRDAREKQKRREPEQEAQPCLCNEWNHVKLA